MNNNDVEKISSIAQMKANLIEKDFFKYFMRSVVAGFFIIAAMIFSNVVGNVFSSESTAWSKLLSAAVFSMAILLIAFIGGELFTGNNFVMAFGAYDKKVNLKSILKIWVTNYIGNFIGCVILGTVFVLAGSSKTASYYDSFIHAKLSIPVVEMFFRAILCNFFVCLAVLFTIKLKDESAKIVMVMFSICAFVISGFEHCIANMGNFFVAYLLVPGLSINAILLSMFVVTIGNIIGGAIFLALPLYLMSDR